MTTFWDNDRSSYEKNFLTFKERGDKDKGTFTFSPATWSDKNTFEEIPTQNSQSGDRWLQDFPLQFKVSAILAKFTTSSLNLCNLQFKARAIQLCSSQQINLNHRQKSVETRLRCSP